MIFHHLWHQQFDDDGGVAHSEPDGTLWRTGGQGKGKDANGVGSQ